MADFLGKVDDLNLLLQSTDITFCLDNSKVDTLMKVEVYCENLENGHCFQQSKGLLNLANRCTSLSIKVWGRLQSKKDVLGEFKENFLWMIFKKKLHLAFDLSPNTSNLKGFDIFSNIHINKLTDVDK